MIVAECGFFLCRLFSGSCHFDIVPLNIPMLALSATFVFFDYLFNLYPKFQGFQ